MNEHKLCPGFTFVCTAHSKDSASGTPMHSDVCTYAEVDMPDPPTPFCCWQLLHVITEFKAKAKSDPYLQYLDDKLGVLENGTDQGTANRGQMLSYAANQMDRQARLSLLSVGIYGSYARFFRFDHSSTVVSEAFDIHQDPWTLVEFFLRYAALTPQQRGFDPTVSPTTDAEKKLFHSHIKDYLQRVKDENLRLHPQAEGLGHGYFPILRVRVNDMDGSTHWYLICRPDSTVFNVIPCGRFTRGFFAVPVSPPSDRTAPVVVGDQKGKLFWLKDCWRPATHESEYAIYMDLKAKNVPNLPEVICGGDVCFGDDVQQSQNDAILADRRAVWVRPTSKALRHMVHHRIVQGLLIPLECVDSAKDLVYAGRDILECK